MPLIFIALFLGSFLIGAGTGYVSQGQQGGLGGGTPVATTNPNVTPTSNPRACYPKVDTTKKIRKDEIVIEAREFLQRDGSGKPVDCTDSEINHWTSPCCNDDRSHVCCAKQSDNCEIAGSEESAAYNKDNYQKILDRLFGKNAQIEGTFNPDRTQHSWVLVKERAPFPSWKIAFSSGHAKWMLPSEWWGSSGNIGVFFREATRIGRLELQPDSPLKARYQGEAAGDVWVGTGWCPGSGSGDPPGRGEGAQSACSDPLIRNVLLVVYKKGRGPQSGRAAGSKGEREGADLGTFEQRLNTWWFFDVYYDEETLTKNANDSRRPVGLPPGPSNDDLPCWMRVTCEPDPGPGSENNPRGRLGSADLPCWLLSPTINPPPGAYKINPLPNPLSIIKNNINKILAKFKISQDVSAQTTIQFPQFVSGKSITNWSIPTGQQEKILLNTYIVGETVSPDAATITKIGSLAGTGGNNFDVYAPTSDLTAIVPTVPPTPTPNLYQGLQMIYLKYNDQIRQYTFVHRETTQGETLKLRTFYPPVIETTPPPLPPRFMYEWYTPACKPAIYLYPEKETSLSVYVKPEGKLTQSVPLYNSGWENVLAKPDGKLVYNGLSFPYLYYEAEVKNVNAPSQGWLVKKEDLSGFFNTVLPYLGLNQQESMDFQDYWLKKLTDKPYYFIGLINRSNLDKLENIEFSQKPDQFIRVRFYFEGLDKPVMVTPPLLPKTPQRKGFTAVDWGGIIANGSCSESLTSQ